jgi:hypothetical protein
MEEGEGWRAHPRDQVTDHSAQEKDPTTEVNSRQLKVEKVKPPKNLIPTLRWGTCLQENRN